MSWAASAAIIVLVWLLITSYLKITEGKNFWISAINAAIVITVVIAVIFCIAYVFGPNTWLIL